MEFQKLSHFIQNTLRSIPVESHRYMGIMFLGGSMVALWGSVFRFIFFLDVPYFIEVSLICYIGSLSIFFIRKLRSAEIIYIIVASIGLIHQIYLVEINHFHHYFLLSFTLAMTIAGLPFSSLLHICIILIQPVAYTAIRSIFFPEEKVLLLFLTLTSISTIILYTAWEKIKLLDKIQDDHQIIEQQRIKAAATAKMAALGEMSGGIAHEINNPLAIIFGKCQQILGRHQKNKYSLDQIPEDLDVIMKTVQRIEKIIKGLRTFARDATHDPHEKFPINSLVDETLGFCNKHFLNLGIQLEINYLPRDIEVECQATQISQVILNLLNNARDAVAESPIKWVRLSISQEDSLVRLSVADSGPGLQKEAEEKLFQPFFSTKPIGKGTGLGLSISKGIIDSHKGRIHYERHPNYSEFVIEIPLRQNPG